MIFFISNSFTFSSNLDFNGVHVSKFSAKTICDFNNIRATGNPIIFRDNFAMQYDIAISSDDLKKTVKSPTYQALLSIINVKTAGIITFASMDFPCHVRVRKKVDAG